VVTITDPEKLSEKATWYLATTLPHPGSSKRAKEEGSGLAVPELTKVVHLYR